MEEIDEGKLVLAVKTDQPVVTTSAEEGMTVELTQNSKETDKSVGKNSDTNSCLLPDAEQPNSLPSSKTEKDTDKTKQKSKSSRNKKKKNAGGALEATDEVNNELKVKVDNISLNQSTLEGEESIVPQSGNEKSTAPKKRKEKKVKTGASANNAQVKSDKKGKQTAREGNHHDQPTSQLDNLKIGADNYSQQREGSYSKLQRSIGQGDAQSSSTQGKESLQQYWSQKAENYAQRGRPIIGVKPQTSHSHDSVDHRSGYQQGQHSQGLNRSQSGGPYGNDSRYAEHGGGGRNSAQGDGAYYSQDYSRQNNYHYSQQNSPRGDGPYNSGQDNTHHGGRNSPHHGGRNSPQNNVPQRHNNQGYPGNQDSANKNNMPGHGPHHRNQRQNNYQQKNKAIQFETYWSREDLSAGLKRGELFEGAVRINPKNYEDAYVPLPDGSCDIYISGMQNRNRALNGDIVAIQILDRDSWRVYENDLEKFETKLKSEMKSTVKGDKTEADSSGEDSGPDVVIESENIVEKAKVEPGETSSKAVNSISSEKKKGPISSLIDATSNKSNKSPESATKKNKYTSVKDVLSSGSDVAKNLFDSKNKQTKANSMIQKVGKVVGILEKKHSRAASGHIKLLQDRSKDQALFSPFDHRLPRILLPMADCPKDFYERPNDHASTMYIARIVDWEETSLYAKGQLTRSLGEAGLIEPETDALLIENDVDFSEFTEEVISCLPNNLPWKIPAHEFSYRRDFRKECVFTIDPATARDLDDAVSCKSLGDGMYEVGVHIADVSFFIEPQSALDRVAGERATSVYLTQKVVPMLPRLLCEQLCSLNPDEDRLAFSVCWRMNAKGEIFEEWFGRSVIRSCVKLSYNHAQGFIDAPDKAWTRDELPPISEGFSLEDIKSRTLLLYKISQSLRKSRFDQGALRLDQVKLQFTLNGETGLPNGYTVYQQRESNRLIEEYMLLANMAVATKINSEFPEKAILRCHPPPQSKMIEDLQKTCGDLGVDMDVSSSQAIHQSISKYIGNDEFSTGRMQVLVALCSKPMQNAKYFCVGMYEDESNYHHYALNVPLYTHFTSPIRRYPDVMVHRLLAAALGYSKPPVEDKEELHKEANHCNDKKTNAKRCSEISNDIFFSVFVKEAGPFEERGMVMSVLDRSFDVFILKLGVVKRVYCDKLKIKDKIFDKGGNSPKLTLLWPETEEHPYITRQEIAIFSLVKCILKSDMEPLKWTAYVKRPAESTPP